LRGGNIEQMVSSLEKWASEHGNIIAEMCIDISAIKESQLEMMEMMKEFKSDKNF